MMPSFRNLAIASAVVLASVMLCPAPVIHATPATEFDYQLDSYYTAADFYVSLTADPIPHYDNASELDIYKKLLFSSPLPRFLLIEASVNPLPLTGVWARRQAPALYEDAQVSDDVNLIQAVTTGFEEPWAASLFLGNIINFKPTRSRHYGEGRGHAGYLVSAGNHHIKDNTMIKDDWIEAEWKVKGDRIKPDLKMIWSFRLGAKFHSRREIADVFYVGIKRARTDYHHKGFSWYKNSGILYRFDFSQQNMRAIQHLFTMDKKFSKTRLETRACHAGRFFVADER